MHVEQHKQSAAATSAQTPKQALQTQRRAGICMHISALPGDNGIGELGAAAHAFVDTLADAGCSVWQFLPTGPTAYGDSPYQPLSAYAGNPMLIAMDELVALDLLPTDALAPLHALPQDHTDYGQLIPLKSALLDRAALAFADNREHPLQPAFARFIDEAQTPWLRDYALFRTLKTLHDERPWPQWPAAYRQRDAAALAQVERAHHTQIHAVRFAQFMFYRQWQALQTHAARSGVLLFGDMPIYIALDCADAWANHAMLRLDADGIPDAVAGVPPDYFSADGQLWGNPLYDWDYHRQTGFNWWIARMQHTLSMVDIVRIDHFRGFEAYWAVPFGAQTAREGAWEPGPADALFDAIRAALGELLIVAEDLGAITPAVDELRLRQRMPGMSVLQFMVNDPDFDADRISNDSVVYTGTHDNDTTLGWFRGGVGDVRTEAQIHNDQRLTLQQTGGDGSDVHWRLLQMALQCAACIAIVPMQDVLGLDSAARFNTPGNPGDNWRWRMPAGAFASEVREQLHAEIRSSGR